MVRSASPLSSGASFTGFTVNRKLSWEEETPSLTVTVMVAEPDRSCAGVRVSVRLLPLPVKAMPPLGISVASDETADRAREPKAVSLSPTVTATSRGVSSSVTWSAMAANVGRSLTVSTKSMVVVAAPSSAVTVTWAVPYIPETGVMANVRVTSLPVRSRLASGSRAWLDEVTVSVTPATGSSTSVSVKVTEMGVSSGVS